MSVLPLGAGAPGFALTGVDGVERTLSSYDDAEVLVLVQSCNHCPYVIAWEARMIAVQRDYADRGVCLVAINCNDANRYPEDSYEQMAARAERQGFNFDYLHDPTQALARALGAARTPEVFVFDRARKLVYHGAIDDNRDETAVTRHYLREALDAALAGEAPTIPDTAPVGCSVKWLP
jgi:peroxiredoxin